MNYHVFVRYDGDKKLVYSVSGPWCPAVGNQITLFGKSLKVLSVEFNLDRYRDSLIEVDVVVSNPRLAWLDEPLSRVTLVHPEKA